MSTDALELSHATLDLGPLGLLPAMTRRQVAMGRRLGPNGPGAGLAGLLGGISTLLGETLRLDRWEAQFRGGGLRRPAVVAQLTWPRLATRVGIGIEPALAHAIVDQLLGFEREPAESRLQVTPVEWGVLTFLVARGLDLLDDRPGPLGPWDLIVDRVGPDPFDPAGLGPIVTWRWRARVGALGGSVRLWLPESLLALWLSDEPAPGPTPPIPLGRFAALASHWRAEVGSATMPHGLGRLRAGAIVPLDGSPLRGTTRSPDGPVRLTQPSPGGRTVIPARAVADSSGSRLEVTGPLQHEPLPREIATMPPSGDLSPGPGGSDVAPPDIPVTLAVEIGRVNLPLRTLADLKAGDVLELGRHAREPVELTSNGRLVARGELIQIDTELGVRVLSVFL